MPQITCDPCWFQSVICGEIVLILRDAGDDLPRTEHELLLRELEDAQPAVVLAVAARDQPGREVVAPARRERQHLNELRLLLAGQPHDRVVRLHRVPRRPRRLDAGNLPLILAVVEHGRLRHVVRRVDLRLDREDVFGIAHVLADGRRHLGRAA